MPVENYGVLIGPFRRYFPDTVAQEGRYLHGHVVVGAGPLDIDCAVDCNHRTANVNYLHLINLDRTRLQGVVGMGDGYHLLPPVSTSGALDYVRNPLIAGPLGCAAVFYTIWNAVFGTSQHVWVTNEGRAALDALGAMMTGGRPIDRVLVFGARWNNATQNPPWGMHDIHFNQGDPPGQYQPLDGVWQDGGVLVRRDDGSYDAFLVMFTTQTMNTNDVTGLPN